MIDSVSVRSPLSPGKSFSFYRNRLTGQKYIRIVGGLSWPDVKPGWAVVLAAELKRDPKTGKRDIRALAEREISRIDQIYPTTSVLGRALLVSEWAADLSNEPAAESYYLSLEKIPQTMLQTQPPASPVEAPLCRDIKERLIRYAHMIRDELTPVKRLHFDGCTQTSQAVGALNPDGKTRENIRDYPEAAALAFAIGLLRYEDK